MRAAAAIGALLDAANNALVPVVALLDPDMDITDPEALADARAGLREAVAAIHGAQRVLDEAEAGWEARRHPKAAWEPCEDLGEGCGFGIRRVRLLATGDVYHLPEGRVRRRQ